jgi:hypothetical protein
MPADFYLQGMFLPNTRECYKIIKFVLNMITLNCSEFFHFCLEMSSCLYMITGNFLFRYW